MKKLIIAAIIAIAALYGAGHAHYAQEKAHWETVIRAYGLEAYHVEGTERHERRYLVMTKDGYAFGSPIGEHDDLLVALRRADKIQFKHHGVEYNGAFGTEVWLPYTEAEARSIHERKF